MIDTSKTEGEDYQVVSEQVFRYLSQIYGCDNTIER
jgi:hypothetical protein